jgi:peptide/nickel transport system permease protein
MLLYLIRRLLLFVPSLLLISLLAFGLNRCAPGDPVSQFLTMDENSKTGNDYRRYQQAYAAIAEQLGLDRPVFYFTLTTAAYPDTLHRVLQKEQRALLAALTDQYGCWPEIDAYYRSLQAAEQSLLRLRLSNDAAIRGGTDLVLLYVQAGYAAGLLGVYTVAAGARQDSLLAAGWRPAYEAVAQAHAAMLAAASPHKHLLPAFHWHGLHNQYHHWLSNVLRGDWGRSYRDERPVFDKIAEALRWTVLINLLSVLLAYLLAVPIGVYSAVYQGSVFDRWTNNALLLLYSVPGFWLAVLLSVFFTNPQYGMDWFPAMGMGEPLPGDGWWEKLQLRASHLVLPVTALTYGSLAFIARQLRSSMLEALASDYVRTARAKGLPERVVIWRHAFRNALFPLITLLAGVLPAAMAGSLVIETIFNIPGMGLLTIESIQNKDWPVVYALLFMTALLTIAGILLADMLYAWADPRLRLGATKAEQ